MSHQELQIAPGVYITDFRKNGSLVGIIQPEKPLTNDLGLLLDECNTLESKSKMLQFTIQEIKKEENWEEDSDFKEAIEENWAIIIKFCEEFKEKVLKLAELKYHPETAKIQQLVNVDRIETRESHAKAQLVKILKTREQKLLKERGQQQEEGIYL